MRCGIEQLQILIRFVCVVVMRWWWVVVVVVVVGMTAVSMAPVFTVAFFAMMGVLEGRTTQDITQRIRDLSLPTLLANYSMFYIVLCCLPACPSARVSILSVSCYADSGLWIVDCGLCL